MKNTESNIIYGHCSVPLKTGSNPDCWEVVVDYYPESRSFIPYYFETEEEATSFYDEWKKNEHSKKT